MPTAARAVARILCPVDFSEFSRHAFDHAAQLAMWYGASLTVQHVVRLRPAADAPAATLGMDVVTVGLLPEERAGLLDALRGFTGQMPSGVPLELRVDEAAALHRGVLDLAGEMSADLIVLGSHGRSGFERILLGSVAERVVRAARCPVLVVPRRAADTAPDGPVRFRTILCAVDFSEGSLRALEHAMTLAEESDAVLRVVHVIERPPELDEVPRTADFDVDRVRAEAEAEALRRLRALVPEAVKAYCTVETRVLEGAAHHEILRDADAAHADLVVMGVQGRGALDVLVFGSNTARVTRGASCPVLVVPA